LMREMSVSEQRYVAVLAVIADGMTVKDAAAKQRVSRQTMHAWLAKYEASGLEGLVRGSSRPRSCRTTCRPRWRLLTINRKSTAAPQRRVCDLS
jgi:transposase